MPFALSDRHVRVVSTQQAKKNKKLMVLILYNSLRFSFIDYYYVICRLSITINNILIYSRLIVNNKDLYLNKPVENN